jgi:hypothetical protein
MSSSGNSAAVHSSSSASRLPFYALLAVATALVLLRVAVAFQRDLPIWDEASYLDWGRRFWIDGAPLTLPQSPGYSLLLGTLSLAFGSVGAIRIAAIGTSLALSGALGCIAFLRWRTPSAGVLATVLALGSAHSFFEIGVQRTAIAILLIGSVALARDGRKRLGPGAFLLCTLGAYSVRPEVVWAAPILPLAMWGLAPGCRPSKKAVRWCRRWASEAKFGATRRPRTGARRGMRFSNLLVLSRNAARSTVREPLADRVRSPSPRSLGLDPSTAPTAPLFDEIAGSPFFNYIQVTAQAGSSWPARPLPRRPCDARRAGGRGILRAHSLSVPAIASVSRTSAVEVRSCPVPN